MKLSRTELAAKRIEAREMVVVQGMLQKEAGKQLGISEHTIGSWAEKDNWKELIAKQAEKQALQVSLIDGFMDYLELEMPQVHRDVKKYWEKYMKASKGGRLKMSILSKV